MEKPCKSHPHVWIPRRVVEDTKWDKGRTSNFKLKSVVPPFSNCVSSTTLREIQNDIACYVQKPRIICHSSVHQVMQKSLSDILNRCSTAKSDSIKVWQQSNTCTFPTINLVWFVSQKQNKWKNQALTKVLTRFRTIFHTNMYTPKRRRMAIHIGMYQLQGNTHVHT